MKIDRDLTERHLDVPNDGGFRTVGTGTGLRDWQRDADDAGGGDLCRRDDLVEFSPHERPDFSPLW